MYTDCTSLTSSVSSSSSFSSPILSPIILYYIFLFIDLISFIKQIRTLESIKIDPRDLIESRFVFVRQNFSSKIFSLLWLDATRIPRGSRLQTGTWHRRSAQFGSFLSTACLHLQPWRRRHYFVGLFELHDEGCFCIRYLYIFSLLISSSNIIIVIVAGWRCFVPLMHRNCDICIHHTTIIVYFLYYILHT